MPADALAVEAVGVSRSYTAGGGNRVHALVGVSLDVAGGEAVAVMGPSGSGKSTLLFLLAGLDDPDEGAVRITGTDWNALRGRRRAAFRRRACGFIAQGSGLLPQATAAENVEVPLLLGDDPPGEAERASRVLQALERVGLERHAAKLPDQLSGGEQQRAAIARALVARPAVVLADEPTGSLDSVTAQDVAALLMTAARQDGAAVVLVTHDPAVAAHADRVITLHSGHVSVPA
jgi:putative ABC transport system ATP-binding protein